MGKARINIAEPWLRSWSMHQGLGFGTEWYLGAILMSEGYWMYQNVAKYALKANQAGSVKLAPKLASKLPKATQITPPLPAPRK